ncbi:TonB-dependent receptor [Herbaspirillum sp. SJZ107]|uniref:TonB-dependent receptor n=1 Tax=Herbaspirillum sp. SJZ107 TaxID=2572881 RepID=UPI00115370A2|nr:TonB-dependent receptor [Herbaspirillum sp. SJZ107]TQK11674.1 TonB-dependent receptor [Herbaspirillum sp. SJZ107]
MTSYATSLRLKPVCAAVLILAAHAAHAAFAQTAVQDPPGTQTDTQNAGQAAAAGAPAGNPGPAAPTQPAQTGAGQQIQQVQISGLRSSIRSAEAIKRDSVQVVDSVNAQDIGKFPDRAAGDALQRIAGVQVGRDRGETSQVIIRGLPDVATTLDGNEIFTGTGRRLSYQDLPVQSIGGLDVYKSVTPSQIEGGIAGSINVRLRAPFDLKGFNATGYLEERRQKVDGSSATKDKNNPGGGFSVSNRWNTGMGEMGALLDVAFNREHWGYPVQWVDRPDALFVVNPDGTANRLDESRTTPLAAGQRLGEFPNVGGIYNAGDRDRGSIHGAFQWKVNPTLELTAQYLGTGYRQRSEVDYILATNPTSLSNVVLAPAGSYCSTIAQGAVCPIQSALVSATGAAGPYDGTPYIATSSWGAKEHTVQHFGELNLQYREGPVKLISAVALTKSTYINDTVIVDQQVPGASASIYAGGGDGHGGYNAVYTPYSNAALRDQSQFVLRGMVQNWGVSKGEQVQWRNDASYRLGDGLFSGIDAGLRLSQRRVSYHSAERATDYPGAVRPTPSSVFGPGFESLVPGLDRLGGPWLTPSRDFLIDQADAVRTAYGVDPGRVPDDPIRAFDQREGSTTLYLAARWKTELAGIDLSGTVGGRYIHVTRDLRGNVRTGNLIAPLNETTRENNFLPSAAAVIGWRENLQSHVSVGKTITRPNFADLNPALNLIPGTVNSPATGSAGNPGLRPTKSTNSDATLEYYFPKNGFVQAALFHRDIDGYLQNLESAEVINGQTYRVTRPQNSGKGTLRGAELGVQKFFDFLPGFWSGFGVQANYTWIDGDNQTLGSDGQYRTTALTNVAKQNYNAALLYEGMGLTGRLSATHRGDYVDQIAEPRFGQDRIVKGATFVDLSLSYAINKNISIQFDAINITKEKYESYLNDPIRPRDIRYNPTTYGLGLRFSL